MSGKSRSNDRLKLWHKGLIIVLLPVVFEAGFVVALARLLNQAENDIRRQYHAQLVVASVGTLTKLCYDVASELASFATGKAKFDEDRFNESLGQIRAQAASLRLMPSDDRIEKEYLRKVAILADEEIQFAVHARLKLNNSQDGLLMIDDKELRDLGSAISTQLTTELKQLSQYESTLKRNSVDVRQYVWNWLLAGLSINVLAAVFLTIYFSRQFVQRIEIIAENSKRMAKSQALADPLSGSDEIAQVDRAFHEMAEQLAAANQTKQQFVAMITHDLRSPLNAIRSIMELLTMGALGPITEKAQTRVEASLKSCDRLLGLINHLLDIDKLEAGGMEMDFAQIEIASVIKRSVEAVDRLAESHDVKLVADDINMQICGDEGRLIQVLVNLISNAIKFSPKDGTVRVSVLPCEANGKDSEKCIEIRVQDEGRGVPQHMQARIFERFAQVTKTDASEKGGTGLGLAICKAIVEEHRGAIGVISEGPGSIFWIRIPVNQKI